MNTQLLKTRIKGRQSKPVQYALLSSIILNSSSPPTCPAPPSPAHLLPFSLEALCRKRVTQEAVCCHSGALTIRSIHCGWQNLTCNAAAPSVGPHRCVRSAGTCMDWGCDIEYGVWKDCYSCQTCCFSVVSLGVSEETASVETLVSW